MSAQPFDLVLLDVMMPDMNGYEVLEHVKANASLRDIPIIMISALDEIESVIRCIELGAEDYLNKPFNPTLLRARVGALLEKKRLRDEVRRNLVRLEEEMDAARMLQLGMLPRDFPACSAARPVAVHAAHAARSRSRRRPLRLLLCRRSDLLFSGRRRVRQGRLRGDVHGAHAQPGADDGGAVAGVAHRATSGPRNWWKPSIANFARTTTNGCSSPCSSDCSTPRRYSVIRQCRPSGAPLAASGRCRGTD